MFFPCPYLHQFWRAKKEKGEGGVEGEELELEEENEDEEEDNEGMREEGIEGGGVKGHEQIRREGTKEGKKRMSL